MSEPISIYLAGKIRKGHEEKNGSYWEKKELDTLKKLFSPNKVLLLNPAIRMDNLSDQQSVFGRDMTQVFCSDVVFVDARERRGLGVGAEMMWAKMHSIPVITLAPKETHYHKSNTSLLGVPIENFIHPFVDCLSDTVVETLSEGAEWIKDALKNALPIKGPEVMKQAMAHYQETQFKNDLPMREIIESSDRLQNRFQTLVRKEIAFL